MGTSKIVGVGLNKTGTSTLGVCLKHWGYRHLSYHFPSFDQYLAGDMEGLLRTVEQYDSLEDWPWPLIYQEIDQRYPDSKFILTKRHSAEAWFRSKCRFAITLKPEIAAYEAAVYGSALPHGNKEEHIRRYHAHNAAVETYFRDRPDKLLTLCWEKGDGWNKLAEFLGHPVPDIPFPRANQSNLFHYRGENPTLARINIRLYQHTAYRLTTKKVNRLIRRISRKTALLLSPPNRG